MLQQTTKVPSAAELLGRAQAMVPVLRKRGAEFEQLRRISDETIADFEEAGFFRAMRPRDAGGSAVSLSQFVQIVREISRGDASAGWVGAFLISHEWLLTRLPLRAQNEIFADGRYGLCTAVAAPPGGAEKVEGGYKLNGRWRYASAVLHSNWAILAAISGDQMLSISVPVKSLTIHDTWHVPGMKATGSNDVEAIDLFVPDHHALPFPEYASSTPPGAAVYPDYEPLSYPMHRVLALIHAAVAVGVADAALDIFPETLTYRMRPQTAGRVIEESTTHSAFGEATALRHAASLMLMDACHQVETLYGFNKPEPSLEERARLNLSVTSSGVTALQAVDIICRAAGAGIHRTGHPLDRICRDTQVMRNHGVLDERHFNRVAGSVLLGQGLGGHMDPMF